MRSVVLAVLLLVVTSGWTVANPGAEGREEVRRYDMTLYGQGCADAELFDGRVCFGILPGETWAHVSITETSPTASLGLPIAALVSFPGSTYTWQYVFCGSMSFPLPSDARTLEIIVQQGLRAGFCRTPSAAYVDVSPALWGDVRSTFT